METNGAKTSKQIVQSKVTRVTSKEKQANKQTELNKSYPTQNGE